MGRERASKCFYFSRVVSGSVLRVSSLRWFVTESNERERERRVLKKFEEVDSGSVWGPCVESLLGNVIIK